MSDVSQASEPSTISRRDRSALRFASSIHLLPLVLLLTLAFFVRLPALTGPGQLPEREFRSAFIARDLLFAHAADVPSWRREVVDTVRLREDPLEPPLLEHLTAWVWRVTGDEPLWVAHAWSTLFWLIGGVLLLELLGATLEHRGAAWPALAYYLFVPAGLRISTAFQPDSLMVAALLASLLAIVRHHLRPTPGRLLLAAASCGATVLIKPTAGFVLLGVFVASGLARGGLRGALSPRQGGRVLLAAGLSLLPAIAYYGHAAFVARSLGNQAAMTFQPHLWKLSSFWRQWAQLAVWEATPLFLALALAAPLVAGPLRPLLVGGWVGYVVYGLAFPYHIHTHGYYQLPLVVLAAWSTGIVGSWLAARFGGRRRAALLWTSATAMVLALLGLQFLSRDEARVPRFESAELARRIGEAVGHSTRTVLVSRHYGLPLQYQGELGGTFWPRPLRTLYGTSTVVGRDSVEDRLRQLGFVPEYFVITDFASWERHHADLKGFLETRCALLESDPGFLIWGSCNLDDDPGGDPAVGVPTAAEWTDHGEIFRAGPEGSWDALLWGGFAATAIVRDGTFFLYYQGSDGYDDDLATVTNRAVGLATSSDGLRFEKHPLNPVLTWSPTGGPEEGAASAAASIEPDGTIVVGFGANTAINRREVTADGRCATSQDGVRFTLCEDLLLDHEDPKLWASGDELFPTIMLPASSSRIVYYLPNGRLHRRELGVAWGPRLSSLSSSAPVASGARPVPAWGPGGWARLSEKRYALFLSSEPDRHADRPHLDVYLVDPDHPATLTGPVESYAFDNLSRATVVLDEERGTWFLYYRNRDSTAYGVRTAPLERR